MAVTDNEDAELKKLAAELEKEKAAHKKTKKENKSLKEKMSKLEAELKELEDDLPALRTKAGQFEELQLRYQALQKELEQRATSDFVRKEVELEHQDEYINFALTVSQQNAAMKGFMMTKGKGKWKRRYFVAKDSYLFYYKTDKATELNCKFIRLSGCKVVIIAESDFHFKVESPLRDAKGKPRHVYELKCEGKADFVSWTEKIRSEIENAAATRVGLVGAASAGISLDKTVLETRQDVASPGREEQLFKIGDRVHVRGYGDGVVKFYGYITNKTGLWAGIEFDESIGKNSGQDPSGKKHFDCKKNHGLFTRQSELRPAAGGMPKSPRGERGESH